jgi:hypothetical protein
MCYLFKYFVVKEHRPANKLSVQQIIALITSYLLRTIIVADKIYQSPVFYYHVVDALSIGL